MARKGRREKKQPEESGGGGWITTFSDLMSLLLTFFILLFSMSTVSEEKFSAASQSVKNAFIGDGGGAGILDGGLINDDEIDTGDGASDEDDGSSLEESILPDEAKEDEIPQAIIEMHAEALSIIESEGISDQVNVTIDRAGVYLDIQESILFESSKADLKDEGKRTIDSLIDLLTINDHDIVIEGYTDNLPMQSARYPNNWELSTARALSVVYYLINEKDIEPTRLSAKGYGEYRPIAPNDTPENRAKNRRVNIVLVYQPERDE